MELAHYYMMMSSMKRRHSLIGESSSSWEEKAFAEDTSGVLGGIVWPPRSYSCSFCYREFRSAQALGGHMNVHRRDRARLKQNPSPSRVSDAHPDDKEDGGFEKMCVPSSVTQKGSKNYDQVERSSSVGSRLFVDERTGLKRVKIMNTKPCSRDNGVVLEELDLELRLGNIPKLK